MNYFSYIKTCSFEIERERGLFDNNLLQLTYFICSCNMFFIIITLYDGMWDIHCSNINDNRTQKFINLGINVEFSQN